MTRKTLIHIPVFLMLGGSGILLVLPSCVWAAEDSFSAYLEACRFLHEGESRSQAARRFAAVASGRPTDRYTEAAASLAAFLKQMAIEDEAFQEPKEPTALPGKEHIGYLIFKLRDVAEQSRDVPGKTFVLFSPRTPDSPAVALRRMGKIAVPSLLALLEDQRPTRSFSGALNGAYILRYSDVAFQILEGIAGRRFDLQTRRGSYLLNADDDLRTKIIEGVKVWWRENSQRTEAEWLRDSLARTGVGAMWDRLAAAERLVELEGTGAIDFFRERLAQEPSSPHVIRLLWRAGGKRVLKDIRAKVDSDFLPIRAAAFRALVEGGEPDAVSMVVQELRSLLSEDRPSNDIGARTDRRSLRDHRKSLFSILTSSGTPEGVLAAAGFIRHGDAEIAHEAILAFQHALRKPATLPPDLRMQVLPHMASALEKEKLKYSAAWWIIKAAQLEIEWPSATSTGFGPNELNLARERAVEMVKAWLNRQEKK